MELIFRFFDKEEWTTYGTLNVIIPLVIFILFRQKLTASLLIFMSLLGMMHGDLLAKILFTGFLNFLVFENSLAWIGRSILLVISVVLMHMVPYKNPGLLADAAEKDEWDVGLIGAEPQRAAVIAFSQPYVEIQATYLVPAGSALRRIAACGSIVMTCASGSLVALTLIAACAASGAAGAPLS